MAYVNRYGMRGYSPREALNQRYKLARNNLLLIILFTLINCSFALFGGGTYFLFSAFIPYMLVVTGMDLSGKFPEEYYLEVYGDSPENLNLFGNGFLIVMVALAAIGLALYFLAWILSKNHKVGWLIFALVFFSMDTAATFLIAGFDFTMIVDYVFHAWVIFELARGIHVHFKWKEMTEAPIVEGVTASGEDALEEILNSESENAEPDEVKDITPLRGMDRDIKSRTLAEAEFQGYKILYRRANKVNELIVDGMVYDEYAAKFEVPHELCARVGGYDICAGYDGSRSYILVNGNELVSKMRWY